MSYYFLFLHLYWMEVASPSDQIYVDRFLSILGKTDQIPQTGERSCHCPPPVNPLYAMSHHKSFGPLLPHLKALRNCIRDSTPLQSFAATSKGSLPVPLHKNLDQRTTPWAHSCRSELENDVLPGTPSLSLVTDGSPTIQSGECRMINGESLGHLVSQFAPDFTPAIAKSSEPRACHCHLQVWSRSFSISNYPLLHLSSHWSAVFCKASEAPLAIIAQRARPKHTSGAAMSSMKSFK